MATIQCGKCGKRIMQKGEKCPYCDEPIPEINQKKEIPKQARILVKCMACGENISRNAASCPKCGEPVQKAPGQPVWKIILLLLVIGWAWTAVFTPKKEPNVSSISSKKEPEKPRKQQRNTLKGGYFACITEALFDEITLAAINKDSLAVGHLLSKGCVFTKTGVRFSVIDFGIGTSKIRAYVDGESVIVYTNTENIYY